MTTKLLVNRTPSFSYGEVQAYPNNEVLKVELFADGNYKINYVT